MLTISETKPIPQQGIQLVVDFPDASYRKPKTIDVEMMMRRKINRVKKEYQIYMHKVHVLCWIGHGNYVSRILNNQNVMSTALTLVPSNKCYPQDRVDLKYVESVTTWFKDKLSLKQDKNEDKFRPKAPPLNEILVTQIKNKVVTTKKYLVFIFVSMLRALGLQCRVMFNFVTLPLKPPYSELCSLSTKSKNDTEKQDKSCKKGTKATKSELKKLPQLDGNADCSDNEFENIVQLDGSGDNKSKKVLSKKNDQDDVSPPKKAKLSKSAAKSQKKAEKEVKTNALDEDVSPPKRTRSSKSPNSQNVDKTKVTVKGTINKRKSPKDRNVKTEIVTEESSPTKFKSNPRKTRQTSNRIEKEATGAKLSRNEFSNLKKDIIMAAPEIIITATTDNKSEISSKYFTADKEKTKRISLSRKRSHTTTSNLPGGSSDNTLNVSERKSKTRTKSAPNVKTESSKYFTDNKLKSPNANSKVNNNSINKLKSSLSRTKLKCKYAIYLNTNYLKKLKKKLILTFY